MFFSTVAVNLEESSWGSRFPMIMNKLYQGSLEYENVNKALEEINTTIRFFRYTTLNRQRRV